MRKYFRSKKNIIISWVVWFLFAGSWLNVYCSERGVVNFIDFSLKTPPPFLANIINFIVFSGILFVLLKNPLKDFFSKRSEEMSQAVQFANSKFLKAQSSLEEIKKKHDELVNFSMEIRKEMQLEIDAEFRKRQKAASEEMNRIQNEAIAQIQAEKFYIWQELKQNASNAAVNIAQILLRSNVYLEQKDQIINQIFSALAKDVSFVATSAFMKNKGDGL